MTDEPLDRDAVDPRPFAVAAAIFVVLAVLAVLFLREDEGLEVVHPGTFERVDDTTFRAVATSRQTDGCEVIERAQVDLADDTVFVELVVGDTDADACDGDDDAPPLAATITLPEPIGERRLVGGAGRIELPCTRDLPGTAFTCGPDR